MKELERIEQKLNEKKVEFKGAIEFKYITDKYIKIFDINYTTFKRTLIGAYLVDTDKLVLM